MNGLPCVIALALFATAATAQNTTAHSSIADYRITLIDLEPGDGIAPWITTRWKSQFVSATAKENPPWPGVSDWATSNNGEPVTASATMAPNHSESTFSLAEISSTGSLGSHGEIYSYGSWSEGFTLSPRTRLVITGRATANIVPGAFVPDQTAEAHVFASISYPTGVSAYERYAALLDPAHPDFSEDFTVTYSNFTVGAREGSFSLITDVRGVIPVIPEPASYALLLAGLAVAGMGAWRARVSGS